MTIKQSTAMRTYLLGTDDFKTLFDYGWLHIYSGSQASDADQAEPGTLLMEISEQMAASQASSTTFVVSGDQTTIFAASRKIKLDISMTATYATSNTFTVTGDQTDTFTDDRGLRAACGADGTKYVSVSSTSYDAGTDKTTVTTNESDLTSNLEKVFYIEAHTVASSSYGGSDTTVTTSESTITSDITTAYYGLRFGSATSGYIEKDASATWQGRGLKGGSAASFRFYTNAIETGAATDAERFDGTCGLSGDLQMVSTTIQIGANSTLDKFKLTEPA